MQLRIQRSVPAPTVRERNRYPIREMKVGDSFVIPPQRVPRGTINGLGRRYKMKLATRTQPDGSVRVWRVA